MVMIKKLKIMILINKSKELKSFKLDGPELRTQIVTNTNKMILFVSKTDKCGKGSDGTIFLDMKLYNKIHIHNTNK